MKYFGGKSRIAKTLGDFLNSRIKETGSKLYLEPFCGGCWVSKEIVCERRELSDIHPDLIMMWQAAQSGWIPPADVTEEQHKEYRHKESSALRGFIGFGCSWGGGWFRGFARNYSGPHDPSRKVNQFLAPESSRSIVKKIPFLKDAIFSCRSYLDIRDVKGAVIYCDPPYKGTTKYACGDFNHEIFWGWVRELSNNNEVYVSEYVAPDDFEAVISIPTKLEVRTKNEGRADRVEKLFALKKS